MFLVAVLEFVEQVRCFPRSNLIDTMHLEGRRSESVARVSVSKLMRGQYLPMRCALLRSR